MHAGQLFTLRSLTILLLLCFALTAEEAIHLVRSRPNDIDWTRTIAHHPGCTPVDPAGRILRCPVRGYGDMNFLCSEKGCVPKEPSDGIFVTAAENDRLKSHFQ